MKGDIKKIAAIERARDTLATGVLLAHLQFRKIEMIDYKGSDLILTVDGGKKVIFSSVITENPHPGCSKTRIDFAVSVPQKPQEIVVAAETPPTA